MSNITVEQIPMPQWTQWEQVRFEELTGTLIAQLPAMFGDVGEIDRDDPETWPEVPVIVSLGFKWVAVSRLLGDDTITLKQVAEGPYDMVPPAKEVDDEGNVADPKEPADTSDTATSGG